MIVNGKHISQYLPRWLTLSGPACIHYIWRNDRWPVREIVQMWRDAGESARLGEIGPLLGEPRDQVSEFFALTAHRRYEEAVDWYCVNGCCVVTWGRRGNMGGYGPAGCSCDDQDEPRDLARGPIPTSRDVRPNGAVE